MHVVMGHILFMCSDIIQLQNEVYNKQANLIIT